MHIYYQADPALHPTAPGHPERPHRLMAAASGLCGVADTWEPIQPVDLAAAQLAHDDAYLEDLAVPLPPGGYRRLDQGDTVQSETSLVAALGALGGARTAISALMAEQTDKALVLARSPGHHACRAEAMGFCLLGTAAWAALHGRDAHGLRVAVLDFDLHHGNGTEDILREERDAFFASSQQDGIWPGTGASGVSGVSGHIFNTALPAGTGRDAMRQAWEEHFKAMRAFAPDLIVVSAGFDAHGNDPLSGLDWSIADYAWLGEALAREARDLCHGRVLTILEGGYDLQVVSAGLRSFALGLQGSRPVPGAAVPAGLTDLSGMQSPYLKGTTPAAGEGFDVRKLYGRLWIVEKATGALLYTPPEFLQLQDRTPMRHLTERADETGRLPIQDIIALEAKAARLRRFNGKRSLDFHES